jgi:hypothetical protein
MASELRVDTLKDAAGNNSVGMAYVAGGSAKAWCNLDGTSVTAASDLAGVRDSFNISAVVDNAVGDYTVTFSSALGNTNYAPTGMQQIGITSTDAALTSVMIRTNTNASGTATTMTTTANRIVTKYVSTSNLNENDSAIVTYRTDGDLA